ncbi:MAG: TetR/AcrR family transcriptional regulator [Rhodobacterales bacterium]|nr:TetR/AcrR family transcriptional regulator [Rhodobacterales bacterium]
MVSMTTQTATDNPQDPRRLAILKAAFEAFSSYGYRRTAMEDIARAAGMSRAALYLHYRNKEDIFRSLTQFYYDDAVAQVTAVLARDLPADQALDQAFAAQAGQIFEALLSSPHGDELLDTKYASSADIAQAGEARLVAVYAAWLRNQSTAGRISLDVAQGDAAALAATMMAALHGLKTPRPTPAAYRAAARLLARVFARSLLPR